MNQLRLLVAPLKRLEQLLPPMMQNLPIGRSQIAVDQLQSAVGENRDQVVLVTASQEQATDPAGHDSTALAAAVVIQPIDRTTGQRSDSASLIHAGTLQPISEPLLQSVLQGLSRTVDQELRQRGVKFVQWATAPMSRLSQADVHCCQQMGFERIAELEYLSGQIAGDDARSGDGKRSGDNVGGPYSRDNRLTFQAIDSTDDLALETFAGLVHRTYIETLDCPRIAAYRTARQTLAGYQRTQPMASRLWFRVLDRNENSVGCVIMSNHTAADSKGGVIELVYMGLVPESRGRGIGREVLCESINLARQRGADRMIMAVDKENHPARRIYDDTGFKLILGESIWVRSLR